MHNLILPLLTLTYLHCHRFIFSFNVNSHNVLTFDHSFTYIFATGFSIYFLAQNELSFFKKVFIRTILPEFLHIWKYLSLVIVSERQFSWVKFTGS